MLDRLKELWSRWKVQATVVGGVLVVGTVYGTCTYAPPAAEEAAEESAEPAATEATTEAAESAATETSSSTETEATNEASTSTEAEASNNASNSDNESE